MVESFRDRAVRLATIRRPTRRQRDEAALWATLAVVEEVRGLRADLARLPLPARDDVPRGPYGHRSYDSRPG